MTTNGSAPAATASGSGVSGKLVGQVLLAREEPDESAAVLRDRLTERPLQHRVAGLERVDDRPLRRLTDNLEFDLPVDVCERPQVRRKPDSDHGTPWTSTESTAGRSRTIGTQLSPASAEA